MARSRMIRPEFWDDEKLGVHTCIGARLIFIGMWNHSDDYGVVKGNLLWLKNHILPYEDSVSPQVFAGWVSELEKIRCILPFDHEGERFFFIRKFLDHQKVNRPSKQRNPAPPQNIVECSLSSHGALTDETETETETESEAETEPENQEIKNFIESFNSFIFKSNPKIKQGPVNSSIDTIEKLIRIDKYDLKYIRSVLLWAVKDEFWDNKVYSLIPLRKKSSNQLSKFQNIAAGYEKQNGSGGNYTDTNSVEETQADIEREIKEKMK